MKNSGREIASKQWNGRVSYFKKATWDSVYWFPLNGSYFSIWNLWKSLATVLLSRFNIECNYLADRQSVVSMLHNQSKIISSPNQFIMRINWIRYASKSLGHRNCKSKIQRLQLTARAQQNNFLLQKKQYHTLPPPGTKPHRGLLKYLGRCTLVSSMNSFWRNIRIVGFPPEVQSVPANGLQGGHGKQAC